MGLKLIDGKYEYVEVFDDHVQTAMKQQLNLVVKKDWKDVINKVVRDKDIINLDFMCEAIIHFTGSVPEFYSTKRKNWTRVVADGYWNAIGA